VPAQHRFRAYRQRELTKHFRRESVQQRSEERSIGGGEPKLSFAELAFQDGDLVP
jgi:hypothetical protein